jgi:hypothetical protein
LLLKLVHPFVETAHRNTYLDIVAWVLGLALHVFSHVWVVSPSPILEGSWVLRCMSDVFGVLYFFGFLFPFSSKLCWVCLSRTLGPVAVNANGGTTGKGCVSVA